MAELVHLLLLATPLSGDVTLPGGHTYQMFSVNNGSVYVRDVGVRWQHFVTERGSISMDVSYDKIVIDIPAKWVSIPRDILNLRDVYEAYHSVRRSKAQLRKWESSDDAERTRMVIALAGTTENIVDIWKKYFVNARVTNPRKQSKRDMIRDIQELVFELRRRKGEDLSDPFDVERKRAQQYEEWKKNVRENQQKHHIRSTANEFIKSLNC